MFCENCGAKLEDDAKFCTECGTPIEYEEASAPAPQAPQPVAQPQPAVRPQTVQQPGYPPVQPQPMQPRTAQKKSPLIPILIAVGVVLVIAIGVGAFFILRGRSDKASDEVSEEIEDFEEFEEEFEETDEETDSAQGGLSSQIKIPKDASVVSDAEFFDIVGTYEGTILYTDVEVVGMDGAPDNIDEMIEELKTNPQPFTLEIEEDGDWEMSYEAFGHSNRMESSDLRRDDPADAAEASEHLIQPLLDNGSYAIDMDMSEDDGSGSGKAQHAGVYCVDGDGKNLIAGLINMTASSGPDSYIKMAGDFTAYKTSGDFKPENEDADEMESDKDSDDDTEEGPASNNNTASFGKPSETAVKGGKWDMAQSGEFSYIKDGIAVADTWAEDEGGYYYVGPDGCLVYNNFSPDGYWADENGAWDSSVPQREFDIDILNNDYTGQFGDIWSIYLDDGSDRGTAKFKYSFSEKWMEYTIEPNGIGTYVATMKDSEGIRYLITVVDDGETINVSGAGFTEVYKIK
ncbi:MAG: zinc-ribbon domain-containing protein [Lachnospiraceae bacterium]|nr:zinc-ribbon domain-containing protein [Lachnospiraceae bacterium]